ncbi:putative murein peptide carboxypeptidase [anaerobic digester metagenome]
MDFEPFEKYLTENGFKVIHARNLDLSDNQFAGTDAERISAMNDLFENPDVKAIIAVRGGYGAARIVDQLNWKALLNHPKWLCGFSDFTVLLNHQCACNGLPTMHSDMAVHFGQNGYEDNFSSMMDALTGKPISMRISGHPFNRPGKANGILVGGNLSVLYSMLGSASFPDMHGKILFLEDLDEYLYHIDRMVVALKRAGVFNDLAGVVIGTMSEMHDNETPFGKGAEEIILDQLSEFSFPLMFGFPAGHTELNRSFFIGAGTEIEVGENESGFYQG